MAVVVQEMVDADSAGVLFSRDPVTGNPSQIVITANYGLGEVKFMFSLKATKFDYLPLGFDICLSKLH